MSIHETSFYSSNQIRVGNARVFQRVSMNLNRTVGQAEFRLQCRYSQSPLTAFCVCWIVTIVTCESGERTCGCSCLKCTWSKLKGCSADMSRHTVGVGRIISGEEALGDYSKIFPGGAQVVKFAFSHSKLNKQHFFTKNFKIQGGPWPPCPFRRPWGIP